MFKLKRIILRIKKDVAADTLEKTSCTKNYYRQNIFNCCLFCLCVYVFGERLFTNLIDTGDDIKKL